MPSCLTRSFPCHGGPSIGKDAGPWPLLARARPRVYERVPRSWNIGLRPSAWVVEYRGPTSTGHRPARFPPGSCGRRTGRAERLARSRPSLRTPWPGILSRLSDIERDVLRFLILRCPNRRLTRTGRLVHDPGIRESSTTQACRTPCSCKLPPPPRSVGEEGTWVDIDSGPTFASPWTWTAPCHRRCRRRLLLVRRGPSVLSPHTTHMSHDM